MGLHGGKFTWVNPATGATYSQQIEDVTPSKIAAAEAAAAAALGVSVSTISMKNNEHAGDPRKGNK